jgi:5-methylthioadenosine/S-adenosylhomocysteine deaminase
VILAADWVVPIDGPPIRDGAVRVEGRTITEVGPAGDAADERFDGAVILPGLVNAHTHLEYAAMGGFGDGMAFGPWIEDHIRRKAATGAEDSLEQARAGAAACLRSGVTTIADCAYSGAVADAAAEAGLRAIVYIEGFSDWPDLKGRTEARIDATTTTELVRPGISPHAPFTVTLDDYRMLVGLARERRLPVATHLLESTRETQHLDAFAEVLGPDTVAIHVVFADPSDIELMAQLDVPAVHCPRSNALLGCGIAPLPELLAAGVRVGLGTDSPSSAIDFDMWAEMRAAVMHARARMGRADALSARAALEIATGGGAAAIGLGAVTGTLTPGKAADICVLDLTGSSFLPWDDPVTAAVYGGSCDRVALTMVNGAIRYRRGSEVSPTAAAARAKMIHA